MNKDFKLFQKYFTEYQQKFGLMGYKVYFKHEELDDAFAEITMNSSGMVATVRLNNKLPDKDKPFKNIRENAKHEAIHLMLSKVEYYGERRYIFPEEISEAIEELTRKLERLIA